MTTFAIDELCAAAGIERVYRDQFGRLREVDEGTIRALASTIVAKLDEPDLASHLEASMPAPLEPVTVASIESGPVTIAIVLPAGDEISLAWKISEEHGDAHAGTNSFLKLPLAETVTVGGRPLERRRLPLPSLPVGYHQLFVQIGPGAAAVEASVIIAPARAYMPAEVETGPGIWGIALQLYALRSRNDWGIGDIGALAEFVKRAALAGAGAVGVNPMHALYLDEPERASPYSPNSRRYLNPLYIEVAAIPDFAEAREAGTLFASAEFQQELGKLRAATLVDYRGVSMLKRRMFQVLYRSFRQRHLEIGSTRATEFAAFVQGEGEALRRFCIFQALREEFGAREPAQRYWRNWPDAYRDPDSPEVAAFAAQHGPKVEFFAYLQWIAHRQLADCAAGAKEAGMPVGLYRDLAVGVDGGSADAWLMQRVIASGWSIGAPPDAWNRKGQDWGLAPVNPIALRQDRYRSFIVLIRANMRHAGALRIDHILGLWRTFWIRHGDDPARGAYLRNPFGDLTAILALESQRARCMVIGEDLGTLPEGIQDALQRMGILSYRLLYFERNADGTCSQPGSYPRQALVSVGTHDLPTLSSFWRGADLALHAKLGLFDDPNFLSTEKGRRAADVANVAEALRSAGLIGADTPEDAPVIETYRYLARTESRVLMVQIEDALGIADQVNVPGTIDQHPNWRLRLPLDIDEIFSDERFRALCASLAAERPLLEGRTS